VPASRDRWPWLQHKRACPTLPSTRQSGLFAGNSSMSGAIDGDTRSLQAVRTLPSTSFSLVADRPTITTRGNPCSSFSSRAPQTTYPPPRLDQSLANAERVSATSSGSTTFSFHSDLIAFPHREGLKVKLFHYEVPTSNIANEAPFIPQHGTTLASIPNSSRPRPEVQAVPRRTDAIRSTQPPP
jgi:hypothetical protein